MSFLYGGDYNPEQWGENTWQDDWDKLKQANVNSATINVFSWSLLEPKEGIFDFSKLDKIIELLEKNNINIVLATSTAALPFWMTQKYPEVNRVNTNGIRQIGGKRENACPNSPIFQKLASELVDRIAKRYCSEKNITHWHVSNEYYGYCYCDNCARAFRDWLKLHFDNNLSKLNKAWNTNFWSHTYHEWDEILPPMRIGDIFANNKPVLSGLDLAYRKFQSDSLLSNFKMERDIIKKYDSRPVTTNLMGTLKDLDYFKWAKEMDIVSWDNYPSFDTPSSYTAMQHDLMRGLKNKPFMLMEQAPSQQNWQPFNSLKNPKQMKMLSYQAIAHGSNTVQFFQLKQSRNGSEKFHSALISHSLSTNTRVFGELKELGNELKALPKDLKGTINENEVAIIFDWQDYWGLEDCIGPNKDINYVDEIFDFYRAFYNRHINVDMISKSTDFSKYKIVVAPSMYTDSLPLNKKIEKFVANGGIFVTDYMSGISDENDNVYLGGYPGLLKNVLGIKFDETDSLPSNHKISLMNGKNKIGFGNLVCDLVHPNEAKSLAHYQGTFYDDCSALTKNKFGAGFAYYSATRLNDSAMKYLMNDVLREAGIESISEANGIEIVARKNELKNYIFVINTKNESRKFINPFPGFKDILSNKVISQEIILEPFRVLILEKI